MAADAPLPGSWHYRGVSLLLLLLIATPPQAADKVTAKNWQHHPRIEDVRAVFEEVRAARKKGELTERVRRATDECRDWSLLRLATDTSSTVRYFYRAGGGEDSVHQHAFYYDRAGRLRFALLSGAAVNDSSIETRIWFDGAGKELHRINTSKGPGWTWLSGDPKMLIRDPQARFQKGGSECRLGPAVTPGPDDAGAAE